MSIDPAVAGRTYPPTPSYEVGREKIREFADAIGDGNPVYRDPEAAKALGYPDVIAPPTFAIVISMAADAQVVEDPEVGIDYSRVVHGEQRFVHHRPITAGDRLTCTTSIDKVRSAGGHSMVTTKGEIATVEGEPVCTAISTLVVRGGE
jgi:acyl dehydratase